MPRPWSREEKHTYRRQLEKLYVRKGYPIRKVGEILGIAEQTVFQRLRYFRIPTNQRLKTRQDIRLPRHYSPDLAEFFGIMLGDGHLSHFQVVVTLGTKEEEYVDSVVELISSIFKARPKIGIRKNGFRDVYLGSVRITTWLKEKGLVSNKVLFQVDVPRWIFGKKIFVQKFLKGFFDTDGSVYKLRWGVQISFCNHSMPLLKSVRNMLLSLQYSPSQISGYNLYLTKKVDIQRFFAEVRPRNVKHVLRYRSFTNQRAGS